MNILIISGEASGDLHGSCLVKSLKKLNSNLNFSGVGGAKMKDAGVSIFFDIEGMGIVGLIEIFGKFSLLKNVYTTTVAKIRSHEFDAVILVDYPTLNLRLAKIARKANVPVYYYISPQIWAWRKGRIKKIKRDISKMLVILPFEKEFYKEGGVDVEFVGHPFVDIVKPKMTKEDAISKLGIKPGKKVIGLFPGSRKNELKSIFPEMIKAAAIIKKSDKDVQFLLALAHTINRAEVESMIADGDVDIKIVEDANYDLMNIADFLIMTSGSATMEATIFTVPMVILYKANPITFMIARWLVDVPYLGLANLIGKEAIVPELLDRDATPENIAKETLSIIENPERYDYIKKRLSDVVGMLGEPGVCDRAAEVINEGLRRVHEIQN